jgi:DNA (cytosine-5)-methyltransferase 1
MNIEAVDLFCGVGGLSLGLRNAGIKIKGGIDFDPACEYPYKKNIRTKFLLEDVSKLSTETVANMYTPGALRLLAGCAPCQPFSTLSRGADNSEDEKWTLLEAFARIIEELKPEFVSMENVPRVVRHGPYKKFLKTLTDLNYHVDSRQVRCADFGLPQERRRFVLIASRLGPISLPDKKTKSTTVYQAIGHLPPVGAGETDRNDPMHKARALAPVNLQRIKASVPGGTWLDWPEELRSECHRVESGESFKSVYARMSWDRPAPTITTQSANFGTGRFGHPEQHRAITLREAAILQSFPDNYVFVRPDEDISFAAVGRLIGNAVPPKLGKIVGKAFKNHIKNLGEIA